MVGNSSFISPIYEDDFLMAVNKPNNLLVHHSYYARNIREKSLMELLRASGSAHPIHRLDRKTSGLILIAKDADTAKFIQQQFEKRKTKKEYLALVRGHVKLSGEVDSPIRTDQDSTYKNALTTYSTLAQTTFDRPVQPYPTSRYSLLKLSPKTGRMHQLRKHMNKISHPIIGDPKYGNRHHNHAFQKWFAHSYLYLHAHSLTFEHPKKGLLTLKAPLPVFWLKDLKILGFDSSVMNLLMKD